MQIAIPTYMDVIGSLCITISWLLVLILIGAFGMGALTAEVQEPIDYFYFTMATLTTVGMTCALANAFKSCGSGFTVNVSDDFVLWGTCCF